MPFPDLPRRDPSAVDAAEWVVPDPFDLTFEGFTDEAFELLGRLRAHPRIEQYRTDRERLRAAVQAPFKRYRDDLVVNWVLPNRFDFETERNVFSRILKNDFGAGGSHHHLWMAFYRPGRKRLTDLQLSHSIDPDGLDVGLYVGDYATAALARAKDAVRARPTVFRDSVEPLLAGGWVFHTHRRGDRAVHDAVDADALNAVSRADGLWIGTRFPRERVVARGGGVVRDAVEVLRAVWPIYRLYSGGGTR